MNTHPGTQDRYDTELNCLACGARLYLSATSAAAAPHSLRQAGLAGLRCICGHLQIIDLDFKPIPTKLQRWNE